MGKIHDIQGETFGRLTVIERGPNTHDSKPKWKCTCVCGNVKFVGGHALTAGYTQSCGCLQRERASESGKTSNLKHGLHNHPLYSVWYGVMRRCFNTRTPRYYNYGGRGITVCAEWHTPANFIQWGLCSGYLKGLTIDRIDNDGNYEPGNCRWVTNKQQVRNKRNNVFLELDGERKTVSEWCEITGMRFHVIRDRMLRGWSPHDTINRPVQIHGST